MKPKNCLIFGASGQIGRNLIRSLTKNNIKVTAFTRNIHQKGYILKTQANPGYLEIVEGSIFDHELIEKLFKNADLCINLVGILFEKRKNTFTNIHVEFPKMISKLASIYQLKKFVHLSALGIENAKDSIYAQSKLKGEKEILNNFNKAVIVRPSIVYSVDDNFTTQLMTLLGLLPIFPIYYNGKTKFRPIHCSDLTDSITKIITDDINENIIEFVGPDEMTFKEILEKLLSLIEKKRLLLPMPLYLAKTTAHIFQLLPKPLITNDQLRLLKYDNVLSGKYKSNNDFKFNCSSRFEEEVNKYSYMWKNEGEYSKKRVI
ncbi:complex I NDUFA9 subunit family protein [Candidatus Pelagibacter sp.]|nr:complex I NDUFA9 subunit family protein [Candidatus Pelagibacter sp.]